MTFKTELKELTLRTLKAPGSGTVQITDSKVPGFGVRITYRGTKTFYYTYRHKRKPCRLNLGRYPELTLAAARAKAETARGYLRSGLNPADHINKGAVPKASVLEAGVKPSHPLVSILYSEAVDKYARAHLAAHCRESTRREKVRNLRTTFRSLADTPINEITKESIRDILGAKVDAGLFSAAVHSHKDIRALLNWCVRNGLLNTSPTDGMDRPAKVGKRTRKLTPTEIRAVWLAAEVEAYPMGYIIQLALLTAQRRGEVAGMRWDEIDLVNGVWDLPPERTKNNRGHIVPLSKLRHRDHPEDPFLRSPA